MFIGRPVATCDMIKIVNDHLLFGHRNDDQTKENIEPDVCLWIDQRLMYIEVASFFVRLGILAYADFSFISQSDYKLRPPDMQVDAPSFYETFVLGISAFLSLYITSPF